MSFIKDFLKKREINKIKKKIAKLQEKAVHWQRNGNLRGLADIMEQIGALEEEIDDGKTS